MKKFFLSMLVGMMALGTIAQIGTFIVKGTFEGLGDSVKFQIVDQFSDYPFAKASYAITGEMLEVQFNIPKASTLKVIFNENGEEVLMTKDHIIPKSLGGKNTIYNLQPMCQFCNSRKGSSQIPNRL